MGVEQFTPWPASASRSTTLTSPLATSTMVTRFSTTWPAGKLRSPRKTAFSASVFGIHSSLVPGRAWRFVSRVPRPLNSASGSTASFVGSSGSGTMHTRSRSGRGSTPGGASGPVSAITRAVNGRVCTSALAVLLPESSGATHTRPSRKAIPRGFSTSTGMLFTTE